MIFHPQCNLDRSRSPSSPSTHTHCAHGQAYDQDGAEAREIAKVIPYFPFKGIPRFYDIAGFLSKPEVFQKIVDVFVERYRGIGIDAVAGMDARG